MSDSPSAHEAVFGNPERVFDPTGDNASGAVLPTTAFYVLSVLSMLAGFAVMGAVSYLCRHWDGSGFWYLAIGSARPAHVHEPHGAALGLWHRDRAVLLHHDQRREQAQERRAHGHRQRHRLRHAVVAQRRKRAAPRDPVPCRRP
jgi:hypothetical protein